MKFFRRFLSRMLNVANRHREDQRLQEEIEFHLAMQTEQNIHAGMDPIQARRHARLQFGSVEAIQERYHEEASLPFLESLLQDVPYALRVLFKSSAFTSVALITVMLGVGANVTVFGVLNAVLLHPLDVSDPQNLYQIRHKPWTMGRLLTTSYPAFEDLQRRNTTFSEMAGFNGYSNTALHWQHAVIGVSGYEVTGNYFDLLGIRPQLGRLFHADEEHGPGSMPYLVISNDLWKNTFNANPEIIGKTVELNRHPFTIIGVTPSLFHGTEQFRWPDYWLPMQNAEQVNGWDYLHNRTSTTVTVVGRLKSGITEKQATENLNAITYQLAKEYPSTDKGLAVRLIRPGLFGDERDVIRGFLYSVSLLALLVLAAACANLASLFAARAADRGREFALRIALGSSRLRLARQLLTEAILVSLIGGAAGLLAANLLLRALDHWRPSYGGHLAINVDTRVYLAGLAFTLGSALLFGMLPARQAWQNSPLQILKSGTTNWKNPRKFALRDLLLCAQIAICTLLVTASLVAVRGLIRALDAPLGIKPQNATLATMDLSQARQDGDLALEKQKIMLEAVRSIPGVISASTIDATPMSGGTKGVPVYETGTTEFTPNNNVLETRLYSMSPGYLQTAGTRLLSGRDISWQDTTKTPYVAIVNETFARKMWGKMPAIGHHFLLRGHLTEVVGVAEEGKYYDLTESPQAAAYVPLPQNVTNVVVFVVRSQMPSNEISAALHRTLSSIEPDIPIVIQRWTEALDGVLFPARAATSALGVMGLLAAMLAVTGIFGMAAYSVSKRIKELGLRVALGARKTQVINAAVGRPIMLLTMGSVLGLVASLLGDKLFTKVVYHANPRDPIVVSGAITIMLLLGVAASAIPAQRALTADPSSLLRED